MSHFNETETRDGLATATALFPYGAEVALFGFGDFLDGLEGKEGVFLFEELLVVVLAGRAVDVGGLGLLELGLVVAEVLLDEESDVKTCDLALAVAHYKKY